MLDVVENEESFIWFARFSLLELLVQLPLLLLFGEAKELDDELDEESERLLFVNSESDDDVEFCSVFKPSISCIANVER